MPDIWIYALASVVVVSLISLIGIVTLVINENRLKNTLHHSISFSAGALLGDAFIHLLPEAVGEFGFGLEISGFLIGGIIFSFIVEKFIRWRHHHEGHQENQPHPFAIMNLVGDAVHNFLDGLIIGASYIVSIPVGVATTVAVIFHEIPQEIGDFGVLLQGGMTRQRALAVNFLSALAAVAGAATIFMLGSIIENVSSFIVPFAAGMFIYIACSDLIPELHKEDDMKRSVIDFIAFILGIAVMVALLSVG